MNLFNAQRPSAVFLALGLTVVLWAQTLSGTTPANASSSQALVIATASAPVLM